ncbi:FAD-dependent oxidoreductase [Paeniglutamicibacter sp. ORCA_105]|uniref:FAD-dependent oxidoreductase n=1 Tax=Paeniglutamicibacter sp. ORCA_105 TaxID=3377336 RepID=UPI0038954C1E
MQISDIKNLRIAIVGGGYGGAALAKALQHIGAENVHVYEQASALAQVGAGIGLRPPSVELFRKWGIFDAIAAVSSPSDHLEIISADGKHILATEEWPFMHAFEQVNHNRMIHRGDFIDVLLSVLPEGMVHLGHKLDTIVDHGETAMLTFANGTVVEADLVIGADGIRSTVRHQLFSQQEPVFSGEHAYRAVIAIDDAHGLVTDNNPRFYMGENGTIAYNLPLPHRGQLSYDITAPSKDGSWAPQITNDYLVRLLEGFDERIVAVAGELDISQVTSRSVFDIDPIDSWHTDSVALLGDAAHAMLHHQGQGANSAIMDADSLAEALLQGKSVKDALAIYQEIRKPLTDELQRVSRQGWHADAVESAFPANQ